MIDLNELSIAHTSTHSQLQIDACRSGQRCPGLHRSKSAPLDQGGRREVGGGAEEASPCSRLQGSRCRRRGTSSPGEGGCCRGKPLWGPLLSHTLAGGCRAGVCRCRVPSRGAAVGGGGVGCRCRGMPPLLRPSPDKFVVALTTCRRRNPRHEKN